MLSVGFGCSGMKVAAVGESLGAVILEGSDAAEVTGIEVKGSWTADVATRALPLGLSLTGTPWSAKVDLDAVRCKGFRLTTKILGREVG